MLCRGSNQALPALLKSWISPTQSLTAEKAGPANPWNFTCRQFSLKRNCRSLMEKYPRETSVLILFFHRSTPTGIRHGRLADCGCWHQRQRARIDGVKFSTKQIALGGGGGGPGGGAGRGGGAPGGGRPAGRGW